MNLDVIRERKSDLIRRFGPWTAHNIHLVDDIYTIEKRVVGDERQLRRVIQVISDMTAHPLHTLRVLDLGCLEGLYAVELARRGAEVVGVEGREANLEKGVFVKGVLCLNNLTFVKDDVRNLSREKYGAFDVVLCLGILYHLDTPDVFTFLERIEEVTERLAIIDTHVCSEGAEFVTYRGRRYSGMRHREHAASSPLAERIAKAWASLDNQESFTLSRVSLYNLLAHVGFTSVYECHYPREMSKYELERVMLVAIKGQREGLVSAPLLNSLPDEDWPERPAREQMSGTDGIVRRLGKLLPMPVKAVLKRFLSL
jgi:SAM-dependent methyltransferase